MMTRSEFLAHLEALQDNGGTPSVTKGCSPIRLTIGSGDGIVQHDTITIHEAPPVVLARIAEFYKADEIPLHNIHISPDGLRIEFTGA